MAISDYLLTVLRGRQGLAESEYKRRQLALQQEQARAGREAQQQRAYLAALGQLGDLALKGVGMGIEGFEKAQAGEAAGRLAEAQARAQLEGLEEFSPEEQQVLELTEGAIPPPTSLREQLTPLLGEVPAKTPEGVMEPKEIPSQVSPEQARLAEEKEKQKILEEKEKQKIAKEARTPEQKATISSADMGPILAELGVKSKQQPPEQESMNFTIQDLEEPVEDLKEPVEVLPLMEIELPEEEPKAEAAPAEPAEPVPEGEKALETAEKMTGMRIRRFKKSPNELAQEIVDQVYAQKPAGNPLMQFFSGDPAKAQREKLLAKAAVAKEISNTRKQLVEQDFDRFMKEKGMQLREDQVEVSRLAKEVAMRKAEGTLRLKGNMSNAIREDISGLDIAQTTIKNLFDDTREILESGDGLPVGPVRQKLLAAINEHAAEQGSKNFAVNAGLLGSGFGFSIGKGGKSIDEKLLARAFAQIDKTNLTPKQAMWVNQVQQAVQNLGRAREGGKLTDADYIKYVDSLFNMENPQTFLMSLNRNAKDLYDQYSRYLESLAAEYEPSLLQSYVAVQPQYFGEDEISMFPFEAPLSPQARILAERGINYQPSTGFEEQVTSDIDKVLQSFRTETDPEKRERMIQQAQQLQKRQGKPPSKLLGLPGISRGD